ncbi:MAG: putative 4-hydroxybenzoate polyprenyltransferase [Candidatus Poseidoniales archaeon]|nr:putative 4-hydroxybenzoate polyprenyltransferase [Candidatus Poseidoniales archaeon]
MGVIDILDFVKVEHTLFSLPFVFIGAWIAGNPTTLQLTWILIAAVGARGLAMSLNRIIDRDVDADNPRTSGRHLVEGTMSLNTAWGLCAIFLLMLLIGAWQLNTVALAMSWLPVLAFIVYPYTKRVTWTCHLWLGLCLALAPAGAWLGIVGGDLGWAAITEMHWYPTIFWICLGVMFWIAAFDLNYALMDVESDRQQGIQSFPARFGEHHTLRTSVQLTLLWFACFAISNPIDEITFLGVALLMCVINAGVIIAQNKLVDFQKTFYYTSVATGWVLLGGLMAA